MKLNHLDILEQVFREKFRGYDRQEVDTFLQLVARDFQAMQEQIDSLQKNLADQQEKLAALQGSNGGPPSPQTPELVRDRAQKILRQARALGIRQKRDLEAEREQLRSDIQKLRQVRQDLLEKFRSNARQYFAARKKTGSHGA